MRIVALAFLFVFAAVAKPAQAADKYLDCYQATTEKTGGKAVAVCGRLIKSGQWKGLDLARLLSNRALGYIKDSKFDLALKDLDRALQISPDYVFGYDHRGEVWRLRGNYDKAIVEYNNAIRVDPSFLSAYIDRGRAFQAMGDRNSARADFQTVLDMPSSGSANDKWAKDQARISLDDLRKDN